MVANMTHGGRIALLGLPAGEVSVDLPRVVLNMLTLKGVYGREMFETWYEMSVLLQAGLDISHVITHRMSFTDYEAGFDAAASGQCGKVVLDWRELTMYDLCATIWPAGSTRCKTAGLYKHERVIRSPQRPDVIVGGDSRAQPLRQQLSRSGRPPGRGRSSPHRLGRLGLRHGLRAVHLRDPGAAQSAWRQRLSAFLGTDDTILYSSCFDANGGLFETLLDANDAIISDELNHASIIDGIRLCKATRYRYRNRDMADLEAAAARRPLARATG